MHLKFGYLKLYTPIHRLTEIKKFPCRTVGGRK